METFVQKARAVAIEANKNFVVNIFQRGQKTRFTPLLTYYLDHSALFGGLRFTQFCTSMCGIPNCSGWSPRPDFDGLDQFHHWTLRKSQGEAGQGGAHLEGPRCLLSAWKKNFTYKIFLVLQLLLVKIFKFYSIKMEKCQICWFDQLIKSQKEGSQEKTLLINFPQNFTNWEWKSFFRALWVDLEPAI